MAAAALLVAAPARALEGPGPGATREWERCVVEGLADAVTLRLRCAGGARRIERLRGVRAPRGGGPHAGGEPFAPGSREGAERLLAGVEIELRGGIAALAGNDLRLELLARGLAFVEPATAGADLAALREAERAARARGLGAWSLAAWRDHQASVTVPVPLPGPPAPAGPEPLAARAARPGQPSWEERKAAFDAAVRELSREGTASLPADPPRR